METDFLLIILVVNGPKRLEPLNCLVLSNMRNITLNAYGPLSLYKMHIANFTLKLELKTFSTSFQTKLKLLTKFKYSFSQNFT